MTPEHPQNNEINLMQRISEIAEAENFTVLDEMESKFDKYFVQADPTQADRCVDDRPMDEIPDYPYSEGKYTGIMLPGGTFGFIDALRYVCSEYTEQGLSEDEARALVLRIYNDNGWRIGDHIDDGHGEITDVEELKTRNQGCGDQDKKRKGNIPMMRGIVTSEDVDGRFDWARKNGFLPVLKGPHKAKAALINLKAETTYDNASAESEDMMAFNLDLWAIAERTKVFYNSSGERIGSVDQKTFVQHFVDAVIRNYFQTLGALSGPTAIQVRKN